MGARAGGAPSARQRFEPIAESARGVREMLLAFGIAHGLSSSVIESLTLAGSEVATNAVLHAKTPYEVRVSLQSDCVRVEVRDESESMPTTTFVPTDSLSGRGMFIVQTVSSSCGVHRNGAKKTVWFEIGLPQRR